MKRICFFCDKKKGVIRHTLTLYSYRTVYLCHECHEEAHEVEKENDVGKKATQATIK